MVLLLASVYSIFGGFDGLQRSLGVSQWKRDLEQVKINNWRIYNLFRHTCASYKPSTQDLMTIN